MFPDLVPIDASTRPPPPARRTATPALFSPSERAERRFWEFFTAHIRNRNTRLAYLALRTPPMPNRLLKLAENFA